MVHVVYIDVLFAVNLIVNYFILLTVSHVLHRQDKRLRLLAGAAVGAVYALFILMPEMGFLYTALLKVVFSAGIVLLSFRINGWKPFVQLILLFYGVSFLFGGIVFALYLFCSPPGMLMRNGVVYFDLSPVTLILFAGASYVVITLLSRLLHRHEPDFYRLSVTVNNQTASFPALLDTGNSLCEPLSGLPVLVAEYGAVCRLIPEALRPFFQNGTLESLPAMENSEWRTRFRTVPYGGLNEKSGLMPAFRPDEVAVRSKKKTLISKEVFVAVCEGRLCSDGRYRALLSPSLIHRIGG